MWLVWSHQYNTNCLFLYSTFLLECRACTSSSKLYLFICSHGSIWGSCANKEPQRTKTFGFGRFCAAWILMFEYALRQSVPLEVKSSSGIDSPSLRRPNMLFNISTFSILRYHKEYHTISNATIYHSPSIQHPGSVWRTEECFLNLAASRCDTLHAPVCYPKDAQWCAHEKAKVRVASLKNTPQRTVKKSVPGR